MFRYFLIIFAFFNLSVSYAFDDVHDDFSYQSESQLNAERASWDCWGGNKVNVNDNDRKSSLILSTDVCVRADLRPLFVDVYLHNIVVTGTTYNAKTVDILVETTHKVTGIKGVQRSTEVFGRNSEYMSRLKFPALRSGDYDVKLASIKVVITRDGLPVGVFDVMGPDGRNGLGYIASASGSNAAMMGYINDVKEEVIRSGKPAHINFGANYEVPMTIAATAAGAYTSANPGNLLIIPFVNNNGSQYIAPHLLGDTHQGDASRCENNGNAKTADGTLLEAEMYTPDQAWEKLERPLVALNANYFDTREQLNNTTWRDSLCSTPLGIYFDNVQNGPTDGTHNQPDAFYPGARYYIGDDGSKIALDALFWIANRNSGLSVLYSKSPDDNAFEEHALELLQLGNQFVAVSGTGLPELKPRPDATPDKGGKATTRIGVAQSHDESVVYIFQGGNYDDGVTREELYYIFYGLGIPNALELDGGGSAALALDSNSFTLKGASRPNSSCNTAGLWCSKITQPDGQQRPVPGWLGLSVAD